MINHRLFSKSYLIFWFTENIHLWLRPIVIIGILLVSAVIPLKSPQVGLIAVLAIPFVAGGAVIITRWPQLGIIAIFSGLLIPIDGPSGLNASMVVVALMLGLWILDMMLRKQEIKLLPSMTTLPLFMLVVVAIISFGMGLLPWYTFTQSAPLGAQLGGVSIYILSAAAFLLVANLLNLRWLAWAVGVFIVLGSVYIAGEMVKPLQNITYKIYPPDGIGSLFWVWLMVLAFSQAVFNRDLHIIWRLALGILVIAVFYVSLRNQDWKSGWVPPLIAVITMIGFRFWKLTLTLSPLGFLPATYFVTKTIASDQYSWGTRVDAWLIVLEIAKANPILGIGFANYNWYAVLFPIRGYAVRFNSHMQYTDIIAQTGIIGLISYIWFFVVVGWLAWRLMDRVPEGFPRAYIYGALGGFVGTLVSTILGDWLLPFFYNVGLAGFRASVLGWIFLGGLVILERQYLRPKKELDETEGISKRKQEKRKILLPPRKRNVYQNFR